MQGGDNPLDFLAEVNKIENSIQSLKDEGGKELLQHPLQETRLAWVQLIERMDGLETTFDRVTERSRKSEASDFRQRVDRCIFIVLSGSRIIRRCRDWCEPESMLMLTNSFSCYIRPPRPSRCTGISGNSPARAGRSGGSIRRSSACLRSGDRPSTGPVAGFDRSLESGPSQD
jgi:hypothetical protein